MSNMNQKRKHKQTPENAQYRIELRNLFSS